IEAGRTISSVLKALRIELLPRAAAIGGADGPAIIGAQTNVRVLRVDRKGLRIIGPVRAKAVRKPGFGQVRGVLPGILKHELPCFAAVGTARDTLAGLSSNDQAGERKVDYRRV